MKSFRFPASAAIILTAIGLACAACASTGSTVHSGVGDTYLDEAPWYAGTIVMPGTDIGHLPIAFQNDPDLPSAQPASGQNTALGDLLAEMNAYLDELGASLRITPADRAAGIAPDVHFGCETAPRQGCAGYEEHRQMRLAIARPSAAWTTWASTEAQRAGAARVLVISLEVGNYMPRQRDWKGSKEIRLGTGYTVDMPWLTSLDAPASVLQLTGAVIGQDGQAIRIGAEGLLARRTNVALSGLGIQRVISDQDIQRVRSLRRDDLPGRPLAWQVALNSMVAQLTGNASIAAR